MATTHESGHTAQLAITYRKSLAKPFVDGFAQFHGA
jgi:hypothetical protein